MYSGSVSLSYSYFIPHKEPGKEGVEPRNTNAKIIGDDKFPDHVISSHERQNIEND